MESTNAMPFYQRSGCDNANVRPSGDCQRFRQKALSVQRSVKVKTTVGELIYALSEAASGLIPDEKTRYRVVAYMLHKLLDESYGARRPR
jgi:hypothetical protein